MTRISIHSSCGLARRSIPRSSSRRFRCTCMSGLTRATIVKAVRRRNGSGRPVQPDFVGIRTRTEMTALKS